MRAMTERSTWQIVKALFGFPPTDTPTQVELENPPTHTPGGLNLEQHYPNRSKRKPDVEGED
jgi:hypothetical protein